MFFDAKYNKSLINASLEKSVEIFWKYFRENEDNLIEAFYDKNQMAISQFDIELKKLFPKYNKPIKYSFLFKNNIHILTIYFGYSSYVMTIANYLFDYYDKCLTNDWEFHLEKNRKYLLFTGKN